MAEEREVIARLKTEKTGDTGAFKETAGDVRELKEEAAGAAPEIEGLGDAAADAGDAAGEAGENLNEMGEAAGGAGSKMGDIAGKGLAVAAAFKAGWEAGSVLRDVLNDITKGGFDRGIQGMFTSVFNLGEGLDDGADAAQRMMNGMRILKANGIDPVGLSAAAVEKKVAELAKAKNDAAKASEELAAAEEEWAEKLGLSGKALDESSKKLAKYIADFAKQNAQLSQTDLAKIFGPMIQEVLDGYARLGKEAPAEVRKLADGWGILTTAAQKAAGEQSKIVKEMVADIVGAASGLKGSLEAQLGTLNEVFSKIDFGDLGADQIGRAKAFMQQLIDTTLAAGKQIPPAIADQAASMGILVSAMNVASKNADILGTAQTTLKSDVVTTTQVFNSQGQELSKVTTIGGQAGAAAKTYGTQIKEGAEEAGKGKEPLEKLGGTITTAKETFRILGTDAKTVGADVKAGAETAAEGQEPLTKVGKAAGEAGTGLEAAKKGAEGLGAAGDGAQTAATNMKTPLDQVATAAGLAGGALGTINEVKYPTAMGELNAVLSKLKEIETQARTTAAALAAIDEDGPAQPAPSDPGQGSNSGGGGGGGF